MIKHVLNPIKTLVCDDVDRRMINVLVLDRKNI